MLSTRAATPADIPALLAFWEVAGENATRPTDRPDLVARLLARDPASVIVAELDGALVGTVICGWDGWRASLYRLAVSPAHRRRGIASRLLALADERLAALGAERLHAMVLDDNELGQSIWRAAGYVRQEEWSRWVKAARA